MLTTAITLTITRRIGAVHQGMYNQDGQAYRFVATRTAQGWKPNTLREVQGTTETRPTLEVSEKVWPCITAMLQTQFS